MSNLEIARSLAKAGWYVFPLTKERFLVRWTEEATRDHNTIRAWWKRWPEANVGVHCGMSGIVAVDLDRKNGKDGFEALEESGRELPRTFSYVSQSGNGEHHIYRAPEGEQLTIANSVHGMAGVDIRSGNGLVVYAGEKLEKRPRLTPAPEWALVHKKEGDYDAADVEAWLDAERKPEPLNQSLNRARKVPLRGVENGDLLNLLTPVVSSLRRGYGRRKAYEVALDRYTRHYRDLRYVEAFNRAFGKAISRMEAEWQEQKENVDAAEEESTTPAKGKNVYETALAIYEEHWTTKITPDGRPFAVHNTTGRATKLSEAGRGGGLFPLLQSAYIDQEGKPGSIDQVAQVLLAQHALAMAGRVPTADLPLRVARVAEGKVLLDLGERDSSAHVEITKTGWTLRDTTPEATFELSEASRTLPRPVRGAHPGDGYRALRKLMGWSETDKRWLLARGWLVAALLPDVARPLLFMHGRAGSGKSLRGVFLLSVLDPRHELGGGLGKNERDSMVAAGARYLVGWDNITTVSEAISNMICRLVTGGTDERRSLYSDDDLHVRDIRRTGVITGINVPMLLPDALERLIPLECRTISEKARRSETAMRRDFAKAHPAILADVLDDLSAVLDRLPEVQAAKRSRPRMADFSDVLRALGSDYDKAYVEMASGVQREVAESDPFVQAVTGWLSTSKDQLPLKLTATDALEAVRRHLRVGMVDHTPDSFPTQPNGMSALLTKHMGSIEVMGYSAVRKPVRGTQYWTFSKKEG